MNKEKEINLGEPAIKIAGLQIWVHGRQFPDANDYEDGNWLNITAHCGAAGSDVWINGPIIHLPEVYGLLVEAEQMNETLSGSATLDCIEPELQFSITVESLGHIKMKVDITPDNLNQEHIFIFEIDQSYLSGLINSCKSLLIKYPIRGVKPNETAK
jgi:hypothetical protein